MPARRTTILAEPDLLDRVERLARREGRTKTALITAALEAYLAEHDVAPELAFVAIGNSGHGRLSLDGRAIVRRESGRPERGGGERGSGTTRRR
jgi:hypothetical protein